MEFRVWGIGLRFRVWDLGLGLASGRCSLKGEGRSGCGALASSRFIVVYDNLETLECCVWVCV